MQLNLGFQLDLRDALESLPQNPSLEFRLPIVGNVLIVTTAALSKILASCFDAIRRRFDHPRHRAACKSGFFLPDFGFDLFSG